jgi:hypothetical protein
MKISIWILLVVSVFAGTVYFIFSRWNKVTQDYGRIKNEIRIKVHVPIIEENMTQIYAPDSFLASHWETRGDSFVDDGPFHYSKNITSMGPLNKIVEKDLFKMRRNGGQSDVFYIKSTILNNNRSIREGLLTIAQGAHSIQLDDNGIDSVARSWGLDYLIRDEAHLQK